ncbi:hypothetical protein [Lacticaseibacillus saniviri]|uniref:hypothetical protein n=1 Tax=Lacticaseibacillus saniviri TaxID=931533 RepID=UPI0006D28C67|nr:hypothetical protein [Lacticaseibacillus saniviri]
MFSGILFYKVNGEKRMLDIVTAKDRDTFRLIVRGVIADYKLQEVTDDGKKLWLQTGGADMSLSDLMAK